MIPTIVWTPAAELDRGGRDRRGEVGVDTRYAGANWAAANEAHHVDDVALLGKMLAAVLEEHVGRVLRDERDAEGLLAHFTTMAGGR